MKKGTGLFDVTWDALMALRSASLLEHLFLRLCPRKFPPVILDSGDDGLGALWNMPGSQADRIRKDVMRIFEELGWRITTQINLKVADSRDVHVTLNLNSESYYPYRKPNDVQFISTPNPTTPQISSRTYLLPLVGASRIHRAMGLHLEMPNRCTTKLQLTAVFLR